MNELDRLSFLSPEDIDIKTELSKLYGNEGRYDDQIIVLKDLLKIQPNNEGAQSDLAQAYEKSGRDPLDVYKSRFESNPDNISYGLDYSDKLLEADRPNDAIKILKQVAPLSLILMPQIKFFNFVKQEKKHFFYYPFKIIQWSIKDI